MEKRIIAVICVLMLLISLFAACGKKTIIKGKNGMEYVAVTDEEGNTVLDENGDILVYVTDADGKYVKDENGNRQTNSIDFPKYIVDGTALVTPDYKMTFPKGWTVTNTGRGTPTTVDKTYLEINNLGKTDVTRTLDSFFNEELSLTKEICEEVKKANPDTKYIVTEQKITEKQLDAKIIEFSMKNENGEVLYFAQAAYFVYNETIFKANYICNEGGYDSSINALDIINQNLIFK